MYKIREPLGSGYSAVMGRGGGTGLASSGVRILRGKLKASREITFTYSGSRAESTLLTTMIRSSCDQYGLRLKVALIKKGFLEQTCEAEVSGQAREVARFERWWEATQGAMGVSGAGAV